ncbi:MAG: hypothetical protein HZA61_07125 [Candidatus Eisenbacteria bacterium]|uniref:Glycosyltransferase RgtA/B/C/D-like domain-containing protein n=1 Tax=Eiseniibacteriota bacterium TaxID=2212470 RepID=A0A933W2V1_UNCEI|nr:hypothetical protein [Candidatus Eisenbacteria bacterium]
MSKVRPKHPAARPGPGAGAALPWGAIAPVAAALLAAWLHRGALNVFFTTDDLILFERVQGVAPHPATLWRVIPGRLWFEGLMPILGTAPFGWHAWNLALHAAVTALTAVWARRLGATPLAAFTAAALFGTNARLRTAVWPVSGVGELLSAALLLVALIALERRTRRGDVVASVSQGLGLFCKETTALAPMVAWLAPPAGEKRRLPVVPLALGLAVWAYVLATRGSTGSLGGEAYAVGVGPHVLDHLLTYTIWSCDLLHLFGGVASPLTPGWGAAGAALLALSVLLAWRSGERAARAGLWLWALALLPVLPLRNAVYDHYLYVPGIGGSVMLAVVLDRALRGAAGSPARAKLAVAGAGVLVFLHFATAGMFLAAAEGARIERVNLPRDGFQRRLEVVRNAAVTLERQLPREETAIVIYDTPESRFVLSVREGGLVGDTTRAAVRQKLLDAVLDQGRGLRALFPQLKSVRLATTVEPADSVALVFVANADGRLLACGKGAEAHLQVAKLWAQSGMADAARAHLAEAEALHPGLLARRSEAGLAP